MGSPLLEAAEAPLLPFGAVESALGAARFDPERFGPVEIAAFRGLVLGHYRREGRSFPWRETVDPWAIFVSELMLQQTQTERVLPKYLAFLAAFPNPRSLASAPLAELLGLWSGLGYNRRALALKRSAERLASDFGGRLPESEEALLELPGVGPYTARAVLAFAFNRPVVLIETNVRSVFLHQFFPGEGGVADSRIAPLVEASLVKEDPRNWYYALMDYGVAIKKRFGNPNRRSAHYARQSPFADSHRRIRGAILRELGAGPLSREELARALPFAAERTEKALAELVTEGFLEEGEAGLGIKG